MNLFRNFQFSITYHGLEKTSTTGNVQKIIEKQLSQ